jgi:ribonucleoside-diphosphate reductase alpha chain
MQKYIDASISSTINLSENSTVEDIYNIYVEAWKHGLKGVTVWRDNCQRQGILTTKEEEKKEESIPVLKRGDIVKAGNDCIGLKRTLTTGCGSLHCTAYFEPNTGDLRECYLSKGSTGGCQNFMISLSRMISLSARGGIKVEDILDQLKSCGVCPSYAVRSATKRDTSKGSCCPVAVGEALKEMSEEMKTLVNTNQTSTIEIKQNDDKSEGAECPNCHEMTLVHVGGCTSCTSCGFSHCS